MLNKMKYFVAVSETLNFTKAAKSLFVTQSTISGQISSLEQELGCKLLVRDKHHVSLTRSGEVFLQSCYAILGEYERCEARLKAMNANTTTALVVGLDSALNKSGHYMLKALKEALPSEDVAVKIIEMQFVDMPGALKRGELDIALPYLSTGNVRMPGIKGKLLGHDSISLLVAEGHSLLGEYRRNGLKALEGETVFGVRTAEESLGYDDVARKVCAANGLNIEKMKYVDEIETLMLMVAAGYGIAFTPSGVVKRGKEGLCVFELPQSNEILNYYVLWNADEDSPLVPLAVQAITNTRTEGAER